MAPDMEVVGQARNEIEAVALVKALGPGRHLDGLAHADSRGRRSDA